MAELTSFTTTDEVLLQKHIDFKIELVSSVVMRKRSSSESSFSTLSFSSDIDILTLDSLTVPPSSNWTDKIINAFRFADNRRKLLIDIDGQSQLISVEESHKRLLWIGFGLATILLIIANILMGIYINERSFNKNESPYITFPMSNSIQSKLSKPIPKMVLWDMMGHDMFTNIPC